MEYQALIEQVRTRAALADTGEARVAVEATLGAIAHLLDDPAREQLAQALPGSLRPAVDEARAGRFDLAGFLQEVAYRAGCPEDEARYRAQATLSALAAAEPDVGRTLAAALPEDGRELLLTAQPGGGLVGPTGGPSALDEPEVQRILQIDLTAWEGDAHALRRTISLPAENLGALVEVLRRVDQRLRHASGLTVAGDSATITLSTSSVHAVTPDDIDVARRIDELITSAGAMIAPRARP